jgi:hypothetical protein
LKSVATNKSFGKRFYLAPGRKLFGPIGASFLAVAACTSAQVNEIDPGSVATSYTRDLYSGHFNAAATLVQPNDLNSYFVLTANLTSRSVSERSVKGH